MTVTAFDAAGNTSAASTAASVRPVAPAPVYPDLTVTSLTWAPTTVTTGTALTFSAVVRNGGTVATPAGKVVGAAFSVNGTRVTWSSTSTTSLAPGATRTLTATAGTAGATWKPTASGTFTVTATANYGATFTETSTANNTLSKSLGVSEPPGTGLKGIYYNGTAFNTQVLTGTDKTVNFDWSLLSPGMNVKADAFSVRWTGRIRATKNETYTFQTKSDDGVRLWVNNVLLINAWTPHSLKTDTATIALKAGLYYPIKLEYFDSTKTAVIQLYWSSPTTPLAVVPQVNLYPQ